VAVLEDEAAIFDVQSKDVKLSLTERGTGRERAEQLRKDIGSTELIVGEEVAPRYIAAYPKYL
jgi:hypothetical protein